jgi:acyl-CoA reductase-like NAD-dependent aldehyde dehydrogenase
LVCDSSVSLEARITYVVLMGFEGKNGAPAFPELETIAWILKRHRTKVQRYIRELQSVGWLVRDISDKALLVREEQFGPVLPVLRYSDLNDVIARVNDSEFGLGGSVWSSNRDRAFEVATRINSGTVWVNKHLDTGPDIPHAGAKQSGIGVEQGREGLEEFAQATSINIAK